MFYASVIPVLIGGLVDGLALTKSQAGYVASANVYGSACGALLAVFFVKRFSWRPWVSGALLMLMSLDFISTDITALNVLVVVRFVAGVVGGIVTGFAFALIARTKQPDRGFGALIFWQFGLSGLVFLVLPPLMASVGYQLLFFVLVGFSALTLTLLPLLADYPVQSAAERASSARLAVTLCHWSWCWLAFFSIRPRLWACSLTSNGSASAHNWSVTGLGCHLRSEPRSGSLVLCWSWSCPLVSVGCGLLRS